MLDEPEPQGAARSTRPEPKPPRRRAASRSASPRSSIWLRDPYTIYAKHVLRLHPLDAIDTPPGAADRGNLIHDTIGEFAEAFPDKLPDDPVGELLKDIGDAAFPAAGGFPRSQGVLVAALPPHRRMAGAVSRSRRRARLQAVRCRDRRQHRHPVRRPKRSSSRVRADRIERLKDGRYAVLDYKTGAPPSDKQVLSGLSPQLTLEAAILRQGGFKDIPARRNGGRISSMSRLRGGAVAGEEKPVEFKDRHARRSRRSARCRS